MPPNKIDDLFKFDRRTTTIGTAGERGSGLGLLLCRDLVERQGGSLTVRSVVDKGTTFRLELPAVPVHAEFDATLIGGGPGPGPPG